MTHSQFVRLTKHQIENINFLEYTVEQIFKMGEWAEDLKKKGHRCWGNFKSPRGFFTSKANDIMLCEYLNERYPKYSRRISTYHEDKAGVDIVAKDAKGRESYIDTKYSDYAKCIEVFKVLDKEYKADYIWYVIGNDIYIFSRYELADYCEANRDKWETHRKDKVEGESSR